jgi:hippurate hydrolase
MRAFSPDVQALLEARIRDLAEAHAAAMSAEARAELWWNSVPTVTEAAATEAAVRAARRLGESVQVDPEVAPSTGGEDFSYMLRQRPGSFMWLGNGSHSGPGGGQLHTPLYDFNDAALPWGVAYWLSVVNVELEGRLGA